MKINEKILSIPPYISTTWNHISAIALKGSQISITLQDGDTFHIPGLEKEIIDLIFTTHSEYIEKSCLQEVLIKKNQPGIESKQPSLLSQSIFAEGQMGEPSVKFGFASLDGLNTAMQHNPSEMNAPDLPPIVLDKIGAIAKILAPEDKSLLPKDVPNCNCFHCQITRAINLRMEEVVVQIVEEEEEELVSDKELQFSQWDVSVIEDCLFLVTNKLDRDEEYRVFLGSPVGCNCGNENCEHIVAALRA